MRPRRLVSVTENLAWPRGRVIGILLLLAVTLGAGGGAAVRRASPAPQPVVAMDRPASRAHQTLADLDPGTQRGILDAMRAARPVAGAATLAFSNPEQQLHATIAPDRTVVTGRDGVTAEFGNPTLVRAGTHVPLSSAPPAGAGTTHVEVARAAGAIAVTEWWNNTSAGLEQGFTVQARPEGTGPLEIQQQWQSTLTARLSADGAGLVLSDDSGVRLQFDHLRAWDRDGRDLPARLEVRGDTLAMVVDDTRARYPVTIDPTWTQQAYLKASNTGGYDFFGHAVAVSGDTVVVGASGESSSATGVNGNQANNSVLDAGAAYVFVRAGTTWTQQAYLKASNTDASDRFGYSVAVSGDTVVVGAVNEDSAATGVNGNQADNSVVSAGAAYVFVRSGTTWTQQAYLKASNTGFADFFGFAVAVSGDTVVVGAYSEDSAATGVNGNQTDNSNSDSGAAYVFVRAGATWTQQAYLKASNSHADLLFGRALAVSGDTIIAGATQDTSNATGVNGNQFNTSLFSAGAAYVFVRTGTVWTQQAYLKASNTGNGDAFGFDVAVSGNTAVVGAPGEYSNATGVDGNQANNSAFNAGAVYVFVRTGTTWAQQAYLKASNTGGNDQFGFDVAVSGDTVVVGAPYEDSFASGVDGNQADNSASNSGAAYAFVRSGTTWTQQAYLKSSHPIVDDDFGVAVAVSGTTVVVGASGESSFATGVNGNPANYSPSFSSAGAAYAFDVIPEAGAFGKSSPANGATSQSPNTTLSWSASTGATSYEYCIDTTNDNACSAWTSVGASPSVGLAGLTASTTYYWQARANNTAGTTYANGSSTTFWSFTTAVGPPPTAAVVLSPAPGSTLRATTATLEWTGGVGVSLRFLQVGTTPGGGDLYNADPGATSLRATVAGLPSNGSPVYVRLWSLVGSGWQFRDATYTAASGGPAKAELTSPAPLSTLTATALVFEWTGGRNVTRYWLHVGSTFGAADLLNQDQDTNSRTTVSGLPADGRTLYVRLWSVIGGGWQFTDYTVTAVTGASERGELTTPAPGSTLAASTVAFTWSGGTNVTRYWLHVGSTFGATDLLSQDQETNLRTTVVGLPTDGRMLYVRLWSVIGGVWSYNEYTYTAAGTPPLPAELLSPAPSSTLRATTATLEWTGGVGVSLRFLQVGTTPGGGDLYNADPGATSLRATVAGLPSNGSPVYVRLWSLVGSGWQFRDATYTAASGGPAKAELTSPAPLSTLTATALVFEWTGGRNVTRYWLHVGSTFGAADLLNQDQDTNSRTTVSGLPADGRTLYVRLWSVIGGGWQFTDYTVTAVTGASERGELTTPAPGSTLAASTVAFTWSGGTNVTRYWLHVGSTFGATDLLSQDQGTNLRTTVVGLPTDGRMLYVRLWSVIGGVWSYGDYTYTAAGP